MDLSNHPLHLVRLGARSMAVLLAFLALTPSLGIPLPAALDRTLGSVGVEAQVPAETPPTVIFLVRHAERAEDGTSDPPISESGHERAHLLAQMLRDADLTHVHTTDYRRTRATGRPTAEAAGLEMALYDPGDLAAFASRLQATPGRHLVLGHSNTTPELVEALGGDPHGDIDEFEYDRLYVVTVTPDGPSTVLIRFGSDLGR